VTGVRREAAALGLLLLSVGCTSSSTTGAPSPSPTSRFTSSVTLSPATLSPSTPAPEASAAASGKDFGFLVGVVSQTPLVLRFDRALWLSGEAADKAAAAHGDETPVPNDYYIVNDNRLLRQVRVSPTCAVYGSLQLTGFVDGDRASVNPQRESIEDLVRFLATPAGRHTPWHLTYDARGVVTRIQEQYVP
jgi:hypothetical protein